LISDWGDISIKKHVLRQAMQGIVVLFAVSDFGKQFALPEMVPYYEANDD
jgi:hypothetical protein